MGGVALAGLGGNDEDWGERIAVAANGDLIVAGKPPLIGNVPTRLSNLGEDSGSSHRPNGPAEPSPGLRPQADALGLKTPQPRGLKGRENLNRELSRLRQKLSRPFRPRSLIAFLPRASAFGLRSPGL